MLTYWDVKRKLRKISRLDLLSASSLNKSNTLATLITELEAKNIIEIGTYNGISTAVMASVADHVYTFDVAYRDTDFVLKLFRVRHKVSICVATQDQIDFQLQCIADKNKAYWNDIFEFDFAFIDGGHDYESVKHDFELVKFTSRVLFHNMDWPEVSNFTSEIGAEKIDRKGGWGYWTA